MITRHLNELLSRLDRIKDVGCVEIRRNELLHWYGQERLTVNIWRDIHEKWEEISEELLFVSNPDGEPLVFIWGEGLADSETSWFKDIRHYTRKGDAKAA